ncbi:glutamine--fructose-6-phosphate transaminase (isomerizing) [Lacticaseibacillus yichunensis]|uniref:Glutamine--fructose-6-phosphate aminotransferase [isomerizing] n=1 Tax=Lacticaseibacillus yichunensis TaxID=2486015 RepID=A0ABW4CL69_9LACO|nr:glutamine--fructose-6-phosphate transaminase (isomerizing) [Lacticaseibacillus yichunensis]
MCGIVGVIGREDAPQVLLQGLQKLEYRGYDSAGIYTAGAGSARLVKAVGKIAALTEAIGPDVTGTMGIGHTRWATNGKPTEANAHPHVSADGRFYLVHNGVITNSAALRATYLSDVSFASETDTEVVVQLIAFFAKSGLTAHAAFVKTLRLLEGSYAFCLADRDDSDVLYAAKNKSPLLIGKGAGFNLVASDALAMIELTDQFLELNDGEVVTLTASQVQIENLTGQQIERAPITVTIDAAEADKGPYPFYMLKEINEQPIVMRRLLAAYTKADGQVEMPAALLTALAQADRLYIVAAGTSYHAGLIGKPLFESLANVPVEVHLASEFGYHLPLLSAHPLFIFLTQSGETADIREVLVKVKKMGAPTLTITNVVTSTLAREADHVLALHAGPEIAVASTKAYTAQVAVEALLAKALGEFKGTEAAIKFEVAHWLSLAAAGQHTLIDQQARIHELATTLFAGQDRAFYIGRGSDHAVSLEAALKLKEISYVHAEGFAAGELKHGTIALIEPDTPTVAFVTDPLTAARTRSNAEEVAARGGHVAIIATSDLAEAGDDLVVPAIEPRLTPLIAIVAGQLLAYFTSLDRGYDVDRPRNLAKSVTVE